MKMTRWLVKCDVVTSMMSCLLINCIIFTILKCWKLFTIYGIIITNYCSFFRSNHFSRLFFCTWLLYTSRHAMPLGLYLFQVCWLLVIFWINRLCTWKHGFAFIVFKSIFAYQSFCNNRIVFLRSGLSVRNSLDTSAEVTALWVTHRLEELWRMGKLSCMEMQQAYGVSLKPGNPLISNRLILEQLFFVSKMSLIGKYIIM